VRGAFAALALTIALSACNLAPVYSGGSNSPASALLAATEIAPMADRQGFLVRQALLDRFGMRWAASSGNVLHNSCASQPDTRATAKSTVKKSVGNAIER
jgi:hypothetical protein